MTSYSLHFFFILIFQNVFSGVFITKTKVKNAYEKSIQYLTNIEFNIH